MIKNPHDSSESFDSNEEIKKEEGKSSNLQNEKAEKSEITTSKKQKYNSDDSFHSYQMYTPKEAKKMDQCLMCKTNLFKKGLEKFYKCSQCPEMGCKICEGCFHFCHKGHQKIEDAESSLLTVYDNVCTCAEYDHKVKFVNVSGENVKLNETCCFEYISK